MSDLEQPIWDLPVRLFHWALAGLVAFSWWTADTGRLEWHLYSGAAILSLILFRLLWGVFGSSTARFANFIRGPRAILAHVRRPQSWTAAGHTPLGALSVAAMMAAVTFQVFLGLFAVDEDGLFDGPLAHFLSTAGNDRARQFHQAWFWVVAALVGLHVAAIIWYRLRGKKLAKAMITGRGAVPDGAEPLQPGKWWVALLCLAAGIAVTSWLLSGAPFGA